jgi:hypothetical protein
LTLMSYFSLITFIVLYPSDVTDVKVHPAHNGVPLQVAFSCQHHVRGRPCGLLVKCDILDALAHFARVHVRPMVARSGSPSEFWTCRWGGKCGSRMRKENFRRHVLGHLVRWKCSNCPCAYSRDDSARKHARGCGDGRILMMPRLDDLHRLRERTGVKGEES